jgi:hypothetical protein
MVKLAVHVVKDVFLSDLFADGLPVVFQDAVGDVGDIFKTCGSGLFQATSVSVDSLGSAGVMSTGRSSSLPDRKILR